MKAANTSGFGNLLTVAFGEFGTFWEKLKVIDFRKFIYFLLSLCVISSISSWIDNIFAKVLVNAAFKTISLGLMAAFFPYEYYLPVEKLYLVEKDKRYESYAAQLVYSICHALFHTFLMETSNNKNGLLSLSTGVFWVCWCHNRLQGSRKKRLGSADKTISQITWLISIIELVLIFRGIIIHTIVGPVPIIDLMIDVGTIVTYGFGIFILFSAGQLQITNHLMPFFWITIVHAIIQLILFAIGVKSKLNSSVASMIYLNSLLRDLKLKSEPLGSTKRLRVDTSMDNFIVFLMAAVSLIFYYSQNLLWFLLLQYLILMMNLSDVAKFLGNNSIKKTGKIGSALNEINRFF
jgi:hypothetical protein